MKAGKFSSLILALILAALTTGVVLTIDRMQWFQEMSAVMRGLCLAALICAAFAGLMFPLGMRIDRLFIDLRNYLEEAATQEQPAAYAGPKALKPITIAFSSTIERIREREQLLRNQHRELEIKHRITESELHQIQTVLDALSDGVLVTDAFNEIVVANAAVARLFGFEVGKALHTPLDRMISDEHLCRLVTDMRANGNTTEMRHVETAITAGDASTNGVVYDIALSCVENHKQEVAGVVTILRDLTRERELSQMKTDFVSKASHELRTPLSSIRAYVEMLVDGEATDEAARTEFYRIIQNETDRLGRLIDNMLNISRIEAGIVQIERENVDIKALIRRAVDTLEPQAREKEISINTRVTEVDLHAEGDGDMLYQVVLNLLSNAVKYTPEGGRVTVSADSDNLTRSVVLSVSDTGLGIPPDALPRLFEKFFRVENYKRVAKGTGLGLSLCKHIVETVHRGQIGVESKLGMGSKFWFSVPMRYEGARVAA